jgi:hypothetical protein
VVDCGSLAAGCHQVVDRSLLKNASHPADHSLPLGRQCQDQCASLDFVILHRNYLLLRLLVDMDTDAEEVRLHEHQEWPLKEMAVILETVYESCPEVPLNLLNCIL